MNPSVRHFFKAQGVPNIEEKIRNARNQERKLLEVFRATPGLKWSREGLQQTGILFAPTSSYVRAVHCLERDGYIEKVERVKGEWGVPVYLYRLKKANG